MTKDLLVVIAIATIVGDPDTTEMSVRLHTREEKIHPKEDVKEMNNHQEREGVEKNNKFKGLSRKCKVCLWVIE